VGGFLLVNLVVSYLQHLRSQGGMHSQRGSQLAEGLPTRDLGDLGKLLVGGVQQKENTVTLKYWTDHLPFGAGLGEENKSCEIYF
jgi:hypothetical protein